MNTATKRHVRRVIETQGFMGDSIIAWTGNARRAIRTVTRRYNSSHDMYGRSTGKMPPAGYVNPEFMRMCIEHAHSPNNVYGKP